MVRSTHPTRVLTSSDVPVIRGRMGMAGRRWSIISGCFRCATMCAGAMRCTSRSCPLAAGGIPVQWTDISVRHTGYSDPVVRARKLDRDARILQAELARQPDDPFVLFNLGSIAIERQDWAEALDYLNRSLAGSAPTDSITRKLYALIARAHQMLDQPVEALAVCAAGLRIDPDDAELTFREAVVRHRTGDLPGAERCWRRILTLRRPQQFVSMDMGIYGHLTRRNLAVLAEARGDLAAAAEFWRGVLAECPADPDAVSSLRRLGAGLLPA